MTGLEDFDLDYKAVVPFNIFLMARSFELNRSKESTKFIAQPKDRNPCSRLLYYKDSDAPIKNVIDKTKPFETYGEFFGDTPDDPTYLADFTKRNYLDFSLYTEWMERTPVSRKRYLISILYGRHGVLKNNRGDIQLFSPLNTRTKTIVLHDKNISSIDGFHERLEEANKRHDAHATFKYPMFHDDLTLIERYFEHNLRGNSLMVCLTRYPTKEEVRDHRWLRSSAGRGYIKVPIENPKNSIDRNHLIKKSILKAYELRPLLGVKMFYSTSFVEDENLAYLFTLLEKWFNATKGHLYSFYDFCAEKYPQFLTFRGLLEEAKVINIIRRKAE